MTDRPRFPGSSVLLATIELCTGAKRDELLRLTREVDRRGWWHRDKPDFAQRQRTLINLEAKADLIICFEGMLVPGLLQTKVVFLENQTSSLFLEEPAEIGAYEATVRTSGGAGADSGRIGPPDHRTGGHARPGSEDRVTTERSWRKSSYSGTQENCVEVANTTGEVGVRDSKQPAGPALSFSIDAFTALLRDLRS
ncbi:DUF397 domain-containing protein [Actinosynnema sp. CS-041913]|uniref:DUF397 domain-containing protein n=1 Tax=Actinosynnema sp. CS-041913 TaxID=3239917 RepID=UPI003D8A514D